MPDQPEENFDEAAKKFDLERLRAILEAEKQGKITTAAWRYLKGVLCLGEPKEVANKCYVKEKTVQVALNREIKDHLLKILHLPENQRVDWSSVPGLLAKAGYGKNQEPISIDWQQVCREVLKNQNQWLTTHALGSGHRRVSDMYVPLELVERKQPLRLDPNIPPEKGSEYYQEKRTPIKHEDFFEQVFKQGVSLESNGRRIAIIGEPGTGKTTLLQEIASRVEGLPIWVDLAELNPQVEDCLENYLLQKWLKKKASPVIRRLLPEVVPSQEELEKAFKDAFSHNPVWLLLDGVNEIPANLSNSLTWIDKQIREGWIAEARVVLTCRLNVGDIHNDLPGFDIYCNRDFSYPKQVDEFIDKWFIKKAEQESRDNLKAELKRANERIQNLIRNPLRLMLLCRTWEDGVKLQDITKAGLYQRLVKGLYKLKDRDNNPKFKIGRNRQEELNCKLGKLALQAIDSKDARFRLRESSIEEFLGYPDQEDSLFWIARELGWLNQVGLPMLEEKDSDENVYAFFHPTFQEYFAACAIPEEESWQYFLNHIPRNPEQGIYKIFARQWKEVFLFWLGREDVEKEQKEAFIDALIGFEDSEENFYRFRADFLAALGIAEFTSCRRADEIVEWLVAIGFGSKTFQQPSAQAARTILLETNRSLAIIKLDDLITNRTEQCIGYLVTWGLGQVGMGSSQAITTLISLICTSTEDATHYECNGTHYHAIESLGKIATEHTEAISVLLNLIHTRTDLLSQVLAAKSLGQISSCHKLEAINTLLDFMHPTQGNYFRCRAAHSLVQIAPEYIEQATNTLIEIIDDHSTNEFTRHVAAHNLKEITPKHPKVSESNQLLEPTSSYPESPAELLQLICNSADSSTRVGAARKLEQVGNGKDETINTLLYLICNSSDSLTRLLGTQILKKIIRSKQQFKLVVSTIKDYLWINDFEFDWRCYEVLWHCVQNLPYLDFYQAWHDENSTLSASTQTLEAQNLDFSRLKSTEHTHPLAINWLSFTGETERCQNSRQTSHSQE